MSEQVRVTPLQKQLLRGWCKSEYHTCSFLNDPDEFLTEGVWSFSMIDNANLTPQKASGSLADLVKKGIVTTALEPGTSDVPPALNVALTNLGQEIVRRMYEGGELDE